MATHEELTLIREARSGNAAAQLDLGIRYIGGSDALPRNAEAAMHWLGAAAAQDSLDACMAIARHIPLECALAAQPALTLAAWFERAFAAGETQAGLLFAKLALSHERDEAFAPLQERALAALSTVAHCGSPEAQWLWASTLLAKGDCEATALAWARRAAQGGDDSARHALAERAWAADDHDTFLEWALPAARAARDAANGGSRVPPTREQLRLLARCAQLLAARADANEREIESLWEAAASHGDRHEQFAFGLWLARRRADGEAAATGRAIPDYEQAIQWLILAGRQGSPEAWHALSRIYGSPLYDRQNAALQRHYRQKAAECGHRQAQYECGVSAWKAGEERATNTLRALYWLELASAQGCTAADEMLHRLRQSHAETLCKTLIASNRGSSVLFTA